MKKLNNEMFAKKIVVLDKNTPSFEAARTLNEKRIGCALVSNGKGEFVGIVTDRDLACGILGEKLYPETPISEVMATDLKFIFEKDSFSDALKIMQRFGVRRVPVFRVNDSGSQRCVGIYTLDDFLLWGDVKLEDLRPIVKKQILPVRKKRVLSNDRKLAHREQKLNEYNKVIAGEIGFQRDLSEKVAFFLLKEILHHVPIYVAKRFISQLPSLIQEDFLASSQRLNSTLEVSQMKTELVRRYGIRREKVTSTIPLFWAGLDKATHGASRRILFDFLPKEFQDAVRHGMEEGFEKDFLSMKGSQEISVH